MAKAPRGRADNAKPVFGLTASNAMGTYLRALRILGMDKDIEAVAYNDELGRKLHDAKLLVRTPRGRAGQRLLGSAVATTPEEPLVE